jgi:plasmid stability protein
MNTQTITVDLPDGLYSQLKQRAERWNRSIEAEMVDVLSSAIPVEDSLPANLEEELSRLDETDDGTLRLAARGHLSFEVSRQLEDLHLKRQREGLSEIETEALARLFEEYERAMLIRAHAAALWKQRGYNPSELLHTE